MPTEPLRQTLKMKVKDFVLTALTRDRISPRVKRFSSKHCFSKEIRNFNESIMLNCFWMEGFFLNPQGRYLVTGRLILLPADYCIKAYSHLLLNSVLNRRFHEAIIFFVQIRHRNLKIKGL